MTPIRWVVAAGIIGFGASGILPSVFHLPRDWFVGVYGVVALGFFAAYLWWQHIDPRVQLRRRWVSGMAGGLLVGALLARTVSGQTGSSRPGGGALAWALVWDGGVYGFVDGLLLSVFPVLVVYGSRPAEELRNPMSRWRWGLGALLASLFVTAAYHLGFAEYRGAALAGPLVGNLIVTLSYLATGSPIAALLSHMMMHGAAVLHGMATTTQLPPHY